LSSPIFNTNSDKQANNLQVKYNKQQLNPQIKQLKSKSPNMNNSITNSSQINRIVNNQNKPNESSKIQQQQQQQKQFNRKDFLTEIPNFNNCDSFKYDSNQNRINDFNMIYNNNKNINTKYNIYNNNNNINSNYYNNSNTKKDTAQQRNEKKIKESSSFTSANTYLTCTTSNQRLPKSQSNNLIEHSKIMPVVEENLSTDDFDNRYGQNYDDNQYNYNDADVDIDAEGNAYKDEYNDQNELENNLNLKNNILIEYNLDYNEGN
jgi:hypothetical protein